MSKVAILSMHTSPLAQPGTGDGGGMNVYVRELAASLARSGRACEVYTRLWSPDLPGIVQVEPGFQVKHVAAGPLFPVAKEELPDLVPEFAYRVARDLEAAADRGEPADALHANYWLSGMAGHSIKHELGIPLVSTFHTLDRLKAEEGLDTGEADGDTLSLLGQVRRAQGESEVMACSDAIVASCSVEADQIVELYGADRNRIAVIPPGVDRAYFSPGDRAQARRAVGLPVEGAMLLFVGRIQPLKGATVAVDALAHLGGPIAPGGAGSFLVVVGGPSGPHGPAELERLRARVLERGLVDRVHFVEPQPHELLSTYYRAADVCVVPSRSESFGLVALEASACGVPVVASAVGGLLTLVDHGSTGYLVDERDPRVFAHFIANILTNPSLAGSMSAKAAMRARGYTWHDAARALASLYGRVSRRELVECG